MFSSGSPSVCSVSGSTVSFTAAGTCVVRANQSGNASYQPAPQVQQSFTVVPPPSPQTITFTSSAPGSAIYLGPNYNVTATASSGLPVSFTVSGTCTLSGSSVVMAGAGTCTVYANQSGSSAYLAAPQVQQTFAIAKRSQTITFPDPGNFDKNDPPFPLSATSTSGLAVTYTVDPSSASICSVSGNMVTPLGERGDCIVHANQAGQRELPGRRPGHEGDQDQEPHPRVNAGRPHSFGGVLVGVRAPMLNHVSSSEGWQMNEVLRRVTEPPATAELSSSLHEGAS